MKAAFFFQFSLWKLIKSYLLLNLILWATLNVELPKTKGYKIKHDL